MFMIKATLIALAILVVIVGTTMGLQYGIYKVFKS